MQSNNVAVNYLCGLIAIISFLVVSSCYLYLSLSPTKLALPLLVICAGSIFLAKTSVFIRLNLFDLSVVMMLIAGAAGQSISVDLEESLGIYISYLYYVIFYFSARICFYNEPDIIETAMRWSLFSVIFSGFLGVFQVVTGTGYMPSTEIRSITTDGANRACGMFDDPNYFGFVLVTLWPLIYVVNGVKYKSILFLFLVGVVVLTLSRASIIIVFLQILTLMYFRSRNKIFYFVNVLIFLAVFASLLLFFQPEFLLKRFSTLQPLFSGNSEGLENSAAERVDLLFAGLRMFQDHYISGVGFGSFQLHSAEYMSFSPRKVFAHNTYLTVAAETGIFGFFVFLVPLFWMVVRIKSINEMLFLSLIGVMFSYFFLVANYFPFLAYLFAIYGSIIGLSVREPHLGAREYFFSKAIIR